MATFEYIQIPIGATRLRSPERTSSNDPSQTIEDIRPAPKITTALPHPSPPSSPTAVPKRKQSLLASTANAAALASPTISLIPQLLLSATLPPLAPGSSSSGGGGGGPTTLNPRRKMESEQPTLLSARDPLSLPIMSTNFKRFITIVGPVFWLQDRVEEVLLWKKGWLRTAVWMAAYSLLCFYPRVLFLLPHLILIGAILSTYPYPATPDPSNPLFYTVEAATSSEPVAPPATEGSVPWQANIQAIQNLMGALADLHALVEPYLYHLCLTPAHLAPPPGRARPRSSSVGASSSDTSGQPPSQAQAQRPRSPYTPLILTLLVTTLPLLLFIVHLPFFPLRTVCLVAGLAPFVLGHPYVRMVLPVLVQTLVDVTPIVIGRAEKAKRELGRYKIVQKVFGTTYPHVLPTPEDADAHLHIPTPLPTLLQRLIDNDRLSDAVWSAELREVELYENERYAGPLPIPTLADDPSAVPAIPTTAGSGAGGWSKSNLRADERSGWTRGRDGWSGVGRGRVRVGVVAAVVGADGDEGVAAAGAGTAGEEGGEVSSNLTFSLAPGWSFVETEDWRKDLQCAWSGCGGDFDGWVYTNDAWLGPRPHLYASNGGSMTRRRRWVRRVWYDHERAKEDS